MNRRHVLTLAVAGMAGMAIPSFPALASSLFPADGESRFRILRSGRPVGEHRIDFARSLGVFTVRSASHYALGADYRFTQQVEETWREGWLAGVTSDTNDGGVRWHLHAERDANGIFSGRVNALTFTVSGYLVPSSLWNRDTPSQEALFDVRDGHVKLIQSALIGEERVAVDGRQVAARRYRVWGQLRRDLWYAEAEGLVRAGLPARDGGMLDLVLG